MKSEELPESSSSRTLSDTVPLLSTSPGRIESLEHRSRTATFLPLPLIESYRRLQRASQETTHSAEKTDSLERIYSEFRIGHMNSTEFIRNLQSINGITIENLEAKMRPGGGSKAGFLGIDEFN